MKTLLQGDFAMQTKSTHPQAATNWLHGTWALLIATAALFTVVTSATPRPISAFGETPLPEFHNQNEKYWINSKPLSLADLKGKVVLIEIWTSV